MLVVVEVVERNDRAREVDVIVLVADQVERGDGGEGPQGGTQADQPEISESPPHRVYVRR